MTQAAREAFEKAVMLEVSGDLEKALVSFLKAQELAPQDTEIAYRAASALLQAGYLEEAQSQLRRIVFAEPDHMGARASLGNCQLLMGDTDNARQNFEEVLQLSPDNRNALYGLANVLLKERKPAEAMGPARQLLEQLPDTPAALTLFADIQAGLSQAPAAIAAYRKALKVDKRYLPAMFGLCDTLLLRKRFDEVIELAIRANEIAPADSYPLELLSDALMGKGALEDALEAAEEALKIAPRSVPLLVRLSVLFRKSGSPVAALKHALAGHDLDVSGAGPLNALGAALAALKHSGQARSVLTGLSSGVPLDPAVRRFAEELIAQSDAAAAERATSKKSRDEEGHEASASDEKSVDDGAEASSSASENSPGGVVGAQAKSGATDTEATYTGATASGAKDTGTKDSGPIAEAGRGTFSPDSLFAKDEPLPNVLGLSRQDKS